MQEWTYRHDMARVDIAGVDKSARYGKGGHCGSGQYGTIVARVDNAGVDNAGVVKSAIWVVIIGYFNNRFMDFNRLFVAALARLYSK